MVPKRPFPDEGLHGTGFPAMEAKKLKNAATDVLSFLTTEDLAAKLGPFLQDVVRDEVEKTFHRFFQSSSRSQFNQDVSSGRRRMLLHFDKKLARTIFTGGKVEAMDGSPINIMLLDADTGSIITSGALSSMKIEILALDGDFGSDDNDNWSESEFAANVIREREGRRPLITGQLHVSLRNGVGQIGEISFTDNSSWQRSRKFRLGVQPVQKTSGVREARSDAFVVKDHRGELYKKHHPPALKDEVWRLEKIAKDGVFHSRLASHGIRCVRDFLQLFIRDPSELREILGGISSKNWDIIVSHATTCPVDDGKFYTFYESEQRVGLLFDSVYKVVGAMFDDSNYERLDRLSPPQKALVDNIKRKAYKNFDSFILAEPNSVPRPLTDPQPEQLPITNLSAHQLGFPATVQGQPEMQLDFGTSPGSISYTFDHGNTSSHFEVPVPQNSHPMQVFTSPALRQSFKLLDNICGPFLGESSWPASSSSWPIIPNGPLTTEENPEVQASTRPQIKQAWSPGNTLFFSSEGDFGIFSSHHPSLQMSGIKSPRAGWCKLRAALNLGSVRKEAAAKRFWHSVCS